MKAIFFVLCLFAILASPVRPQEIRKPFTKIRMQRFRIAYAIS